MVKSLPEECSVGIIYPAFEYQVPCGLLGPVVAEIATREYFFNSKLVGSEESDTCF